jgi:zinc protease
MRRLSLLGILLAAAALHADSAIPDRPEKLSFPPLTYEPPNPADFRVPLQAGPVAYVVPDRELPLVTVTVMVRAGAYLEPSDKVGLASFTGYLLARGGTEGRTAEELEERLAFLAAQLTSGVFDDSGTVTLNLLSKDLTEGLSILREVLTQPRFQADKLELQRQQTLQQLKQRNDDSSTIEAREAETLAYGTNFWSTRQPTLATINAIQREDLQAFHKTWFHPGNFVVAVSGDFERSEMIAKMETLFAGWPFRGDAPPAIPTNTAFARTGVYVVDKDVPQGRVSLMLPGIRRDDPDYPAVLVMNDILGGGGFTSRIMNRVRSDEGLAYSAGSSFAGGVYYPLTFQAGFQSKNRTVAYATSIVADEMKRITASPVTDEELKTAKRSFIDTFPENFNTRRKVAGMFAQEEFTGRYARQPDFWKTWRSRLEAVSAQDVQRVAAQRLTPDKTVVLVVGKKEELLKGHPDHPVKLSELTSGPVTELPLRDPLTLEPLPPAELKSEAKPKVD